MEQTKEKGIFRYDIEYVPTVSGLIMEKELRRVKYNTKNQKTYNCNGLLN